MADPNSKMGLKFHKKIWFGGTIIFVEYWSLGPSFEDQNSLDRSYRSSQVMDINVVYLPNQGCRMWHGRGFCELIYKITTASLN